MVRQKVQRCILAGHDIRNTQYYRGSSVSPSCGILYYLQELVSDLYMPYYVDYFSQPALPTADDDLGEISNEDARSAIRSILASTADLTSTVPLHHPPSSFLAIPTPFKEFSPVHLHAVVTEQEILAKQLQDTEHVPAAVTEILANYKGVQPTSVKGECGREPPPSCRVPSHML